MRTTISLLLIALLSIGLTGCNTFGKKKEEPPVKTMRDQSGDTSFQSFLGMLRRAVQKKDKNKLAQLMTPDFGYALPDGEGISGAFQYWDQNDVWPALNATVQDKFAPAGAYMVAPAMFALQGGEYQGYRLGVRRINGSWRFAYFIGN